MRGDFDELVQKYFDDQLTAEEIRSLQEQLTEDAECRTHFVQYALLHDRLRSELVARATLLNSETSAREPVAIQRSIVDDVRADPAYATRTRSVLGLLTAGALAASLLFALLMWRGSATEAYAAQSELKKIITVNSSESPRTFLIEVETTQLGAARPKRSDAHANRPPKPPLDGAVLHVRGKDEFVLIRQSAEGAAFVTGCDGRTSWAVRPDGPVRVSDDLQRFNRDVPGHEFSMPLCNIDDALRHLQAAFDLHVLPVEYADLDIASSEPRRLLVATKRRGNSGPRRVEITYLSHSGQIEQLRFVDMPYGPDRLTVRLSLMESQTVAPDYFSHSAHHASDRKIEFE